jgi:hypothetical protein
MTAQRDPESDLLHRLRLGHRLLHDEGTADPGWRSHRIVGHSVRSSRTWDPAVCEALLLDGFIRPVGEVLPRLTRYELGKRGEG